MTTVKPKDVLRSLCTGLAGALWIYCADLMPRDSHEYWFLSFAGGVTTGCSLGALLCYLTPVRKSQEGAK